MKFKFILPFILSFFLIANSFGQKRVVIMGSSTAYGAGASVYPLSWAGRSSDYYNQNSTDGLDTLFYNIAVGGYDTYLEMPTGFIPPAGRPFPDENANVTKALSYNPDVVIINLPSNDLSFGYAKSETMCNFRIMYAAIVAAGASCYITTPQPRNDFDQNDRDSLRTLVDSVYTTFNDFAIDFWYPLVTTDGLYNLKPELIASSSVIHVNDDGHDLLFQRIRDKFIFGFGAPLPLTLTGFQARLNNNAVLVNWNTQLQQSNTNFDIQRSSNNRDFETISSQYIPESRQTSNYSGKDLNPLPGKSFYRIKITEPGRQFYSGIASVINKESEFDIIKIYTDISASHLIADINIQKSQPVVIRIINIAGAVLQQQEQFISQPTGRISLPISNLAKGQYYLSIRTNAGSTVVKAFTK